MKTRIILTIFTALFPIMSNAYFDDIATTHPNFQAIQWLERNNIIEGYQTNSGKVFKSTQAVTRAEALKILLLGANVEIKNTDSAFPDVPKNEWFAPFVATATNKDIVNGFNDGNFHPQAQITKAELLKMAIYTFDAPVEAELGTDDSIEWHQPFIEFGKKYRLIDNEDEPLKSLTRGEVSEIIFRTNNLKEKNFQSPYIYSGNGLASYYGIGFHGKTTANGEIYDSQAMTAAHRTLPFNTRIKVWLGEATEKYVIVRITDRGPYHKTRVLDLSEKAFSELAPLSRGILEVNFEVYSDKNKQVAIPEIAREKFSAVAQNLQIPKIVEAELKKKSDFRYITEKKTIEITGETNFFNQTVAHLAESYFTKIRLYKPFPQLIRTGTVLKISGQVTERGHKTITFFYQPEKTNSSQESFEFTSVIDDREFAIDIPMVTEGKFKMGVVLDDEKTSRVANVEVRISDFERTFPRSKESFENNLEIQTVPEKKIVRLSWKKDSKTDLYKLTFGNRGSYNILREVFIPGDTNSVTLPYSFFQSFSVSTDQLSVDLFEAESADGSLSKQQSNWGKSAYQNFIIVPQFQDTESFEISLLDFKRFLHDKETITINGKRFDKNVRIKEIAYLTLPNKSIIEIPITFNQVGDFEFSIIPNDWGTYVLEIMASTGKILFNRAFYLSKDTVLPVGKTNIKSVNTVSTSAIYNWINNHRKTANLPILAVENNLQKFAQKYAEQMAIDDFVGHISPTGVTFEDRIKLAKFQGSFSENVAFGSNINLALSGLESSASHFSNIVNSQWSQVGIGLIQNKKGVYISQIFGK